MRERMAYLIMIGMLLVVVLFVMAVIGKGEYQPPSPEHQEKQAGTSPGTLLWERSVSQAGLVATTFATGKDRGTASPLAPVAGG